MKADRILVHESDRRRIPVDPEDIFYLEAEDHDTLIRRREKRLLREVRGLGELEPLLEQFCLVRVHRNYVVNLHRVREFRRRANGDGWELQLQPPVNRIIPVGRTYETQLWATFDTSGS